MFVLLLLLNPLAGAACVGARVVAVVAGSGAGVGARVFAFPNIFLLMQGLCVSSAADLDNLQSISIASKIDLESHRLVSLLCSAVDIFRSKFSENSIKIH